MNDQKEKLFHLQQDFAKTIKLARAVDPKMGEELESYAQRILWTATDLVERYEHQEPLILTKARAHFSRRAINLWEVRHLNKCLSL